MLSVGSAHGAGHRSDESLPPVSGGGVLQDDPARRLERAATRQQGADRDKLRRRLGTTATLSLLGTGLAYVWRRSRRKSR